MVGTDDIRSTPWDDIASYMIVDPWGRYGGENLGHTMTHEMNHAFQSRDDWYEAVSIYEGSATFVEWDRNGLDSLLTTIISEYQRNACLAPDAAGEGDTWYPYGFSLYLRFVQHTFAAGEASFLGRAWEAARNRPTKHSDVLDALESVLPSFRYEESVVPFARWRWYTGDRCRFGDCSRDPDAHQLPSVDERRVELSVVNKAIRCSLDPAPLMLGSSYLAVHARDRAISYFEIRIGNVPKGARVVAQAVPGLDPDSSGDEIPLHRGRGRVRLGPDGWRTVIITVLPRVDSTRHRSGQNARSRPYPLTISLVGR